MSTQPVGTASETDPLSLHLDGSTQMTGAIVLKQGETIDNQTDGVVVIQGVGGVENYNVQFKLQNDATSTLQIDSSSTIIEFLKAVQLGDGKILQFGDAGNDRYGKFQMLDDSDLQISTTAGGIRLSPLTTNGFVKTSGSNGFLSVDTNTYLNTNQTTPQYVTNGAPVGLAQPTFTYSSGVLTRIDYPSGYYKTFSYNGDGTLASVNYGGVHSKTFTYSSGLLTSISVT